MRNPDTPLDTVWVLGDQLDRRLGALGRGEGRADVDDTPWVPRAHGRETTYQRDLEPGEVDDAVRVLAAQVVDDIRAEGRPCARVHLKVRFTPFFTVNRSRKLPEPTWDAGVIADTALAAGAGLPVSIAFNGLGQLAGPAPAWVEVSHVRLGSARRLVVRIDAGLIRICRPLSECA